jgi:hypothetical protein
MQQNPRYCAALRVPAVLRYAILSIGSTGGTGQ